MRTLGVAFCLLLSGCQLDTSGMPDLPAVWRTWYVCGEDEKRELHYGESVWRDSWTCMADVDGEALTLTCDKPGTQVKASAYCHEGSGRMLVYVGQCLFETVCGD